MRPYSWARSTSGIRLAPIEPESMRRNRQNGCAFDEVPQGLSWTQRVGASERRYVRRFPGASASPFWPEPHRARTVQRFTPIVSECLVIQPPVRLQRVRSAQPVHDGADPPAQAAARFSSSSRSRALRVSAAARSNSVCASPKRPSLKRMSPRTLGKRW